jgi:putative oxidoreductase
MLNRIISTDDSKTTIIIRFIVGAVFFIRRNPEISYFQKSRGAGRFEKIGLPSPEFLGSFVGFFEILCGRTYS